MTRTFIALEKHEAMQRHLERVHRQVAHALPGVRCVDPAGIHLTLAFLGELDDEQLAAATQAAEVAASRCGAFSYRLGQLGIFGSLRQPRVIWMGVDEQSGMLRRLHQTLEHELVRRGFAVDPRPFSPHLTLARCKAPLGPEEQQQLQRLLARQQASSTETYQVRHIEVMKSELFRTGAIYTPLKSCPLGHRR
ncbi:MAG: RNA 2',3'-cyclic phosphodiesterase [Ktedonobacteraceae bacterium]|nr:RNA 2',3'-cyclic phosphodiesterase [Ktedonobacteraceae bacterium]